VYPPYFGALSPLFSNNSLTFSKILNSLNMEATTLKGIHFISDDAAEKIAVQIDLREHQELWEQFYEVLLAESRKHEPRRNWRDIKRELKEEQLL
jgi:hypothetical protein